jgi:hypothetical protein
MESVNKGSKSRSRSRSRSRSEGKSKSRSGSEGKSKSRSRSRSRSKKEFPITEGKEFPRSRSRSKKEFPITEGKKFPRTKGKEFPITKGKEFPKFPKNVIVSSSHKSKKSYHHSMNPIVYWPPSRRDVTEPDTNIGCLAPNLPVNVRARLASMHRNHIACRGITLKNNGQYTIFGSNDQNYVVGDEYGFGKNKKKRSKRKQTKKKR